MDYILRANTFFVLNCTNLTFFNEDVLEKNYIFNFYTSHKICFN